MIIADSDQCFECQTAVVDEFLGVGLWNHIVLA